MIYSDFLSISPSAGCCWAFRWVLVILGFSQELSAQNDTVFKTSRLGKTPDAYILDWGEVALETGGRGSYQRVMSRDLHFPRARKQEYLTLSSNISGRMGVLPRFEVELNARRVILYSNPFEENQRKSLINLWDAGATGRLNVSHGKNGAPVVTLNFTYGAFSLVDIEGVSYYKHYGATISKLILKHHLLSVDFLWTGSYDFKYKYGYRTRGGSTYYLEVLGNTWKSAAAFENFFTFGGGAQFKLSDWLYMDVGVEGDREKQIYEWEEITDSRLELRVGASVILD